MRRMPWWLAGLCWLVGIAVLAPVIVARCVIVLCVACQRASRNK